MTLIYPPKLLQGVRPDGGRDLTAELLIDQIEGCFEDLPGGEESLVKIIDRRREVRVGP